ncbi:MAG: type II secretory pathway, component PulD, partial [Opitutaceae bacterium]|nr:type II secretory pathway, component PulD [Opitutaceae bacterium]
RDTGDFLTARKRLAELSVLAPNDPAVKRMLADVNKKLTGEPAAATVAAFEVTPAFDAEAEAMARAEGDRLRQLIASATEARKNARRLLREGDTDEAIASLDAAAVALPLNPLTQSLLADLQKEKIAALLYKTRSHIKNADALGARNALEDYKQAAPGSELSEGLARQVARLEQKQRDPTRNTAQGLSPPPAVVEDDAVRLVARGRSQYLAGEPIAAAETFRQVQALEPDNPEAAKFLARIEQEHADLLAKNRAQTRLQLLDEVDKSWQRPGVFQERATDAVAVASTAPLALKLEEIMLPNVRFTKVEIGRVVSALSADSEEFDTSGVAAKGVNIVLLDPAAKAPTVTITLRNTSLRRVLDFVTQAVDYQYEIQADAVVVRPAGGATTLDTAFFPVTRATVLRMTGLGGGPALGGNKAVDPFSSAHASNDTVTGGEGLAMRGFLQQAGVNFEATPGSSLAYDGSAIIVTQTARNLERIRNILNRYNDIRQVEIEAKFMEVQEGALEELGVNWTITTKATQQNAGAQAKYMTGNRALSAAFNNTSSNQQGSIVRPQGEILDAAGDIAVAPELNIPIINNAPQIPGSAYLGAGNTALASITGVIGEFDVNAIVRALSQKQGTDLLSAPKVTVLSGNPATMTVAQELRYPQSFGQTQSQVGTGNASGGGSAGVAITAGTPQEFATRNVGVELKVTPTVEEDDYSISLDLNPKVTEFDGFIEYGG